MSKKISQIKQRIREYADFKGFSQRKFHQLISASDSFLKSSGGFNVDIIPVIRQKCPDLSIDWLLFEEGKMIINEKENFKNEKEKMLERVEELLEIEPNKNGKGTPYYDLEFESGFTFLESSQLVKPTSYIHHPYYETSDVVVRNSGYSMETVIKHGDSIGLKHLPHWREFLAFGEVYALVLMDDRRMVKIITAGSTEESFTLVSKPVEERKEEFPPQEIKKKFIREIFRVEAASCWI